MPLARPGNYRIRPARPEDVDQLAEIERLAFDPAKYGGLLMSKRSFLSHINGGMNPLIVAEDLDAEGALAGYALGFVRRGSPYLRFVSLALSPKHNARGAAGKLFQAIEDHARERGYRGVRLEVREDNHRLIKRYVEAGYRVFATVPDYYSDGAGATRMVRDLDSPPGAPPPET